MPICESRAGSLRPRVRVASRLTFCRRVSAGTSFSCRPPNVVSWILPSTIWMRRSARAAQCCVVGDDHHRLAVVGDVAQDAEHLLGRSGVEIAGGLVGHDDLGAVGEAPGPAPRAAADRRKADWAAWRPARRDRAMSEGIIALSFISFADITARRALAAARFPAR